MLFKFLRSTLIAACPVMISGAAPLRILAIGDSMTEEYTFEVPFSAPESDPLDANTRNWPELLDDFRPADASLGPYKSTAFTYGDLRNAGHEWNFGVPGMTVLNWFVLINTDDPTDPPLDEDLGIDYYDTRRKLIDELAVAQVVVILLGANDLKQDYDDIFNGTEDPVFYSRIRNRLDAIHDWVRLRTSVPIVVCTIPDVGATPQISGTYSDPVKQAGARAKIAALNQSLLEKLAENAVPPTVARIDLLTDRLFDETPFHLNGTVFTLAGDPENPPDHVFCRDGFHVATVAQALIANEIIGALNSATGSGIPPFSDREILGSLLGLDPDQPFLDWIAAAGFAGSGPDEDPDRDGFPNLAEYLLGSPPGDFNNPLTGSFAPGESLSWRPDPVGLRYGILSPEESGDLATWSIIPEERITPGVDGSVSVTPSSGSRSFFRLRATVR